MQFDKHDMSDWLRAEIARAKQSLHIDPEPLDPHQIIIQTRFGPVRITLDLSIKRDIDTQGRVRRLDCPIAAIQRATMYNPDIIEVISGRWYILGHELVTHARISAKGEILTPAVQARVGRDLLVYALAPWLDPGTRSVTFADGDVYNWRQSNLIESPATVPPGASQSPPEQTQHAATFTHRGEKHDAGTHATQAAKQAAIAAKKTEIRAAELESAEPDMAGIVWCKDRWEVRVKHLGKKHYAGRHSHQSDAIAARDAKRRELGL
jgi:hypothetical protein